MAFECYCHIEQNQPFKLQDIKTVLLILQIISAFELIIQKISQDYFLNL